MKRILFSLLLAAAGISASAMNARDAREYAYFLTDKMAYELNLTPLQYERVYEVNLDYFLAINSPYNIDRYQEYRDDDLRYILSERQYWDYINANYFYRPLFLGTRFLGFLISIIVIAIAITITLVDHPVMIVTKVPIGHCRLT